MKRVTITFWITLAVVSGLWLAMNLGSLHPAGFFQLRDQMVQYTGTLAMTCMSFAMILALRPRWSERLVFGLDKTYRLHKWLGVGGLVTAIAHWLWAQGPKWATQAGWLTPPKRGGGGGVPAPLSNSIEQLFRTWRGTAEGLAEWPFYLAVLLIVLALVHRIPYRFFYKTHRYIALAYLVLVAHSVILFDFASWVSPLGVVMLVLCAYGVYAAVVTLVRQIGAGRKVDGTIRSLHYYPELRVIEGDIDVPRGWPGHKAGQFAFVTSEKSEGAHPYSIASAWDPSVHRLTIIAKELGDWTGRLRETLHEGKAVKVEGPYGYFTFDDGSARQIWVAGGIGITPFIARMRQLAAERRANSDSARVDLFHTTTDYSEEAIEKMRQDASAAGIRLHVLHDARDGFLTGDRIRATVPEWRDASIWFCGPSGFGAALRDDFAAQGVPVGKRFHQEIFSMR